MKTLLRIVCSLLFAIGLLVSGTVNAEDFSTSFAKSAWNPSPWLFVIGPMKGSPSWIQKDGWIENDGDSTNMLLKAPYKGDVTVTSNMAFLKNLAPLVIFASKIKEDGKGNYSYDGPYIEVVIYNKGINAWRDGKRLVSFCEFPMQNETKYRLEVTKKGNQYTVKAGDHTFGFYDDSLTGDYYVGVSGCEGVDRIYDFSVAQVVPPAPKAK
ncbi:MAG: hypothetical protein ABI443_06530 [Chthoniobacterales bacterium]